MGELLEQQAATLATRTLAAENEVLRLRTRVAELEEVAVQRVRAAVETLWGTREFEAGPYSCGWDDAFHAALRALADAGTPAPGPDTVLADPDPLVTGLAAHLRREGWGRTGGEAAAMAGLAVGWLWRQGLRPVAGS